jgi:hypothetical protein
MTGGADGLVHIFDKGKLIGGSAKPMITIDIAAEYRKNSKCEAIDPFVISVCMNKD